MNPSRTRDVMYMYKESRAITARLNQTVQEWVLTQIAGESDIASRKDMAQSEPVAAGDRQWEALLAENAPLAFRVARGVLRNDADAEDVAQEALLRAYRRLDRLRERDRFRAWIVRISFRLALDRLRAYKRRQARESQWVFENSRNSTHHRQDDSAEFQRQLDRALDELPEKQRLVVLLA